MNAHQRTPDGLARSKQAYRKPRLTVHGDLHALTAAKRGTKNDGAGKPMTRAGGTRQ